MLTVIVVPLAPVLHLIVPPVQLLVVKIAVSPSHNPVLLLLIIGAAGLPPVLIVISFDFGLSPQIVSQTTEYTPAVVTVIAEPVAPVLHFKVPLQFVAVKIAPSVPQTTVLLLVIFGVVGLTPVRMISAFELSLLPQVLPQVAV